MKQSLQNQSETTSLETLQKSFSKLKINAEDINRIAVVFQEFLFVRHEKIEDYPNIAEWIRYWETHGYTAQQVVDMIELGKELPKFRKGQLAVGDLINHWRKVKEEQLGISWYDFSTALKMLLNSDKELIDAYARETTGLPFLTQAERKDIKAYLQLIKERTETEINMCQLERKFKAADLIAHSEQFEKLDQMITYENILFIRALVYEIEHTTRQPLRVIRRKLDEVEKNYSTYYSTNPQTKTQELAAAALKALRIIKGYTENKDKDVTDIEDTLIKHNLLQPEFK